MSDKKERNNGRKGVQEKGLGLSIIGRILKGLFSSMKIPLLTPLPKRIVRKNAEENVNETNDEALKKKAMNEIEGVRGHEDMNNDGVDDASQSNKKQQG
jgi:hypothetical protein